MIVSRSARHDLTLKNRKRIINIEIIQRKYETQINDTKKIKKINIIIQSYTPHHITFHTTTTITTPLIPLPIIYLTQAIRRGVVGGRPNLTIKTIH